MAALYLRWHHDQSFTLQRLQWNRYFHQRKIRDLTSAGEKILQGSGTNTTNLVPDFLTGNSPHPTSLFTIFVNSNRDT
jgi:hypothetical protein